jgi:hypothetical protein
VLRAKLGSEAALASFTAIQNELVRGFLDRHVKGAPVDFPARALAMHPELIVQDLSWLRERAQAELHSDALPSAPNLRRLTPDSVPLPIPH